MRHLSLVFLVVSIAAFPAFAGSETAQDVETVLPQTGPGTPQTLEADTDTELWLLVQSSGKIAGSKYAIPGKVATLSHQRYLNSFRYPIPLNFNFRGGGTGGAGAAASGTGSGTSGR